MNEVRDTTVIKARDILRETLLGVSEEAPKIGTWHALWGATSRSTVRAMEELWRILR